MSAFPGSKSGSLRPEPVSGLPGNSSGPEPLFSVPAGPWPFPSEVPGPFRASSSSPEIPSSSSISSYSTSSSISASESLAVFTGIPAAETISCRTTLDFLNIFSGITRAVAAAAGSPAVSSADCMYFTAPSIARLNAVVTPASRDSLSLYSPEKAAFAPFSEESVVIISIGRSSAWTSWRI